MSEETKTVHVNTSGWEADEVAQLDGMVKQERTDRSKFLRALVRKEWEERVRTVRILKNVKREVQAVA